MFHALSSGSVQITGYALETHLHDVETLNQHAMRGTFDISKLSFHAWLLARERYRLLGSGAALGFGCGPLVVARRPLAVGDLGGCRIAVPGRLTTANLLLQLHTPRAAEPVFTSYDRILATVACGEADCGVIIHESRFTFMDHGFRLIVDLGAWWERVTGLPIPLGCVAARQSLPADAFRRIEEAVAESIRRSQSAPDDALGYAARFAQELDTGVLRRHVETYVNEFSLDLGRTGRSAVSELTARARQAGIVS